MASEIATANPQCAPMTSDYSLKQLAERLITPLESSNYYQQCLERVSRNNALRALDVEYQGSQLDDSAFRHDYSSSRVALPDTNAYENIGSSDSVANLFPVLGPPDEDRESLPTVRGYGSKTSGK